MFECSVGVQGSGWWPTETDEVTKPKLREGIRRKNQNVGGVKGKQRCMFSLIAPGRSVECWKRCSSLVDAATRAARSARWTSSANRTAAGLQ